MGAQGLAMQDASETSRKCQVCSWIEGLSPGEELGGIYVRWEVMSIKLVSEAVVLGESTNG